MEDSFKIDDYSKANWAIKTIGDHQRKILELEKRRDFFIEEYKKRIQEAEKICAVDSDEHFRAIDNLRYLLREFARNNIPDGKKTLKFPEGTLKFSSPPVKFRFENGDTPNKNSSLLIKYLQENNPEFIVTNYSADWAAFKKNLDFDDNGVVFNKTTGELVPNLYADKPDEKFDVLPKEI